MKRRKRGLSNSRAGAVVLRMNTQPWKTLKLGKLTSLFYHGDTEDLMNNYELRILNFREKLQGERRKTFSVHSVPPLCLCGSILKLFVPLWFQRCRFG